MITRKMMWLPVGLLCLALWSCADRALPKGSAADAREEIYDRLMSGLKGRTLPYRDMKRIKAMSVCINW